MQRSVIYPKSLVEEIAGEVSIERLFRYVKEHFDTHADQIKAGIKEPGSKKQGQILV